jgi:broad specificity phosphatase PhoE
MPKTNEFIPAKPITKLILVRHGETDSNRKFLLQGHSDGALNETGKAQVQKLGISLKNMEITIALSSDMQRARDTAREISAHHAGLEVKEMVILRECSVGVLDGHPAKEYHQALTDSNVPLAEFRPEGGETLGEVRKRAETFLDMVERDFKGESILVCAHGDFLRMLISVITQISIQKANGIFLNNASYSIFKYENKKWHTVSINNFLE